MDGRAESDDDDNAKKLHHLSHKRFFKSVFVKQSAQQSSFRRPEAGVGDLHHGVLCTDDLRAPDELVVLGVFHHGVRLAGHVLFVDEHLAEKDPAVARQGQVSLQLQVVPRQQLFTRDLLKFGLGSD